MQTKQNNIIMKNLLELCEINAQQNLHEYKDSARKEEDGTIGYFGVFEHEGETIEYRCTVTVPLFQEYQSDADDYLYVEPDMVIVDNIEIIEYD